MNNDDYALIIDDSVTMRAMVAQTLRQGAYIDNIVEAECPDQALQLINQLPGKMRLIVSDWNMPGMPLPDFMAIIEERPELALAPLFLITGSEESKVQEIMTTLHPTALLTKPFNPIKLLELIELHIGIDDRRRAHRVEPLTRCEVDIGLPEKGDNYKGEVVNISTSGVLIRVPLQAQTRSYIYDYVTLNLSTSTGDGITLTGQIVRLEIDRTIRMDNSRAIKMALQFGAMTPATQAELENYVIFNIAADDTPAN